MPRCFVFPLLLAACRLRPAAFVDGGVLTLTRRRRCWSTLSALSSTRHTAHCTLSVITASCFLLRLPLHTFAVPPSVVMPCNQCTCSMISRVRGGWVGCIEHDGHPSCDDVAWRRRQRGPHQAWPDCCIPACTQPLPSGHYAAPIHYFIEQAANRATIVQLALYRLAQK